MKMGASKPILGDRQTIQNIDFFNSISANCEFAHQLILRLRRKSGLTGRTAA